MTGRPPRTPMQPLTRSDLMSLEDYDVARAEFRKRVIAHKKNRVVAVGEHVTLHFEDRVTIQYQIQEILRAEKIFRADGVAEELEAYNPLIPDGGNWKATMMIEYEDVAVRQAQLAKLIGIDRLTWVKVGDGGKVFAVSNEDLERETEDKTSAVHFLRFELPPGAIAAAAGGAAISAGCDHENYVCAVSLPDSVREALVGDLSA